MAKFLILFHGGKIAKSKETKSIKDRLTWMDGLRSKNKFIDGSPLQPEGSVINNKPEVIKYIHNEAGVSGYVIIEAKDMDEAIAIVRTAPQIRKEYGSAMAEIRMLKPLKN